MTHLGHTCRQADLQFLLVICLHFRSNFFVFVGLFWRNLLASIRLNLMILPSFLFLLVLRVIGDFHCISRPFAKNLLLFSKMWLLGWLLTGLRWVFNALWRNKNALAALELLALWVEAGPVLVWYLFIPCFFLFTHALPGFGKELHYLFRRPSRIVLLQNFPLLQDKVNTSENLPPDCRRCRVREAV